VLYTWLTAGWGECIVDVAVVSKEGSVRTSVNGSCRR
jgi:hypothetical protein